MWIIFTTWESEGIFLFFWCWWTKRRRWIALPWLWLSIGNSDEGTKKWPQLKHIQQQKEYVCDVTPSSVIFNRFRATQAKCITCSGSGVVSRWSCNFVVIDCVCLLVPAQTYLWFVRLDQIVCYWRCTGRSTSMFLIVNWTAS